MSPVVGTILAMAAFIGVPSITLLIELIKEYFN